MNLPVCSVLVLCVLAGLLVACQAGTTARQDKPSARTHFDKEKGKHKKQKPKKPSYRPPTYQLPPRGRPHRPSYAPPHPHGLSGGGEVPWPFQRGRQFGRAVVGSSYQYPRGPAFGPFGWQQTFPYSSK